MTNRSKIYLSETVPAADWSAATQRLREFLAAVPRTAKIALPAFVVGIALLAFQAVLVGALDRVGVSPKISIPVSSFIIAVLCATLTIRGGLKKNEAAMSDDSPAICKILTIRRSRKEV